MNIKAQTNLIRFLFSTQNQSFAMIYHWAAKVCFSVDTKCEMSSYWIFWIIYHFVIHFCCLHSECNLIWLSKINSMSSVQQANSRQNLIGSMRKSQQVSWDYDKLWWKFINNVASLGLVFQECDIFLLNVFIEITWCQRFFDLAIFDPNGLPS